MHLSYRAAALAVLGMANVAAFADVDGPAPVAWRWAESTSAVPGGEPQIDGDNVYVAVGGRIYCIDRVTGNTNWRYPAGEPISGNFTKGCVLSNGKIVAASDDKSVYAVSTDGTLAWQYLSPDNVVTNVVVSGNSVVYGTNKEELNCLDLSSGAVAWSNPVKVAEGLNTGLGVINDQVLYSTRRGSLAALNPITQREAWNTKFSRLAAQGAFSVFGDRIYVNSGTFLVCLRGFNGSVLWQQNVGTALDLAPAAYVDGVATIGRDGKLYSYNLSGRPLFPKGVALQATSVASPTFVGKLVCTVMTNGTINLIDPTTGDAVWNYTMKAPINNADSSGTGGRSGGPGIGGGGSSSAAGAGGAAGGDSQATEAAKIDYTQAAGSAVAVGDSLSVITRDGSVFLFDKKLGVDMTAPAVDLVWPKPGNDVAGKAPMEILIKVEDNGVGVNPESVKVDIDGTEYIGEFLREGYISIKISTLTVNKPLQNGRRKVTVNVSDWMGNKSTKVISLNIDNTLPALGSPKREDPAGGGSRSGVGGFGGDGGR